MVLRALTDVSSTEETYGYCVCLYKFKNVSLGSLIFAALSNRISMFSNSYTHLILSAVAIPPIMDNVAPVQYVSLTRPSFFQPQ